MTGLRTNPRQLLADRTAIAMIELALALPLFLLMVLGLAELCDYALQKQRLSQIALQVADNAGRLGSVNLSGPQRLTEAQINDVLLGGTVMSNGLDFTRRGRIILSSLEQNAKKGQWIHWQRCRGGLEHGSSYGLEGAGAEDTFFPGMGPAGAPVQAAANRPAMFVEVAYRREPLTFLRVISAPLIIEIAAMPARVERDLTKVDNGADVDVSTC